MNKRFDTKAMVLLGLLTAVTLIFSFTPIGTIPIGPLSITLNIIPIALAAVTLGPVGGGIMGAIFGLMSFLQCVGIGVPSGMGVTLFAINPFLAFVQRFIPRLLTGILAGWVFKLLKNRSNIYVSCAVTGFSTAFLNTLLFMSALILLFGNTDYVQELMDGKNVIVFICSFVGINAVCEMIVSTVITGAVGAALHNAKLIPQTQVKQEAN